MARTSDAPVQRQNRTDNNTLNTKGMDTSGPGLSLDAVNVQDDGTHGEAQIRLSDLNKLKDKDLPRGCDQSVPLLPGVVVNDPQVV